MLHPALLGLVLLAAAPDLKATALGTIRQEAKAVAATTQDPLVKKFLDTTAELPAIPARTLYHDEKKTKYFTAAERAELGKEEQAPLIAMTADEERYYTTRYGSPISYSRPLEILSKAGLKDVRGKKILDFGYGYVSHLRMLALLGADARGVDVDPMLRALYAEPGDQGVIGKNGRVTLHHGQFPADAAVTKALGDGYDLFISKNVLKRGYIHPEREANPRHLIDLGVSDEKYLAELHRIVKPGGLVLVYNLFPAQAPKDKPYIPWADGRSPFSRAQWEAAGFEVLAFDLNDDAAIRALARTLGWDRPSGEDPGMDLEKDLFALYSLFSRRSK
jgi:SAM-dependent methyltransferase